GNTDAEGRLVLADALALADEESPDLLIDSATLTGAARVALGPDLPALFCDDAGFAEQLMNAGRDVSDQLWRLPMWTPYRRMLDSPIADFNNAGSSGLAGAITAALFLKEFVDHAKVWAHIDLYGWNDDARPGRPRGGEAMAMRALFEVIRRKYG
ncbi:MAG: leucyl aminopeptidase family protein, partial [Alphaproteobacteria bacterium]|nr:leucyl aminopeptidase family protein [Alphaproteobacteria bacterium]